MCDDTSLRVREFLEKYNVKSLSAYSSDLAPPNFFLFPRMKQCLKGHQYRTVERVQLASTLCLKEIPFADFYVWQKLWQWCIDALRMSFQGISILSKAQILLIVSHKFYENSSDLYFFYCFKICFTNCNKKTYVLIFLLNIA